MRQKIIFPLFNGFIGAIFGAAIGYYLAHILPGILSGLLIGVAIGALIEVIFGLLGAENWLYRRRVLVTVLLEIPLAVFFFGPYAYAVQETLPNRHAICCMTPLDFGAAAYEDVEVQAEEGVMLAGWYVPPATVPGPVIVLLHGARSDRLDTAWHAGELIRAGYGVLMYDRRALGESGGRMVSAVWLDSADLLAVAAYLRSRPEVDPERIGAVGLSGGGHVALNAAAQNPDAFAALWLDGIQAQNMDDFPQAQDSGERFATLVNGLILRMIELRQGHAAPPPFSEILADYERPPTVIVGAGQEDFERRVHEQYKQIVQENVYMWTIEDAGHVGGPAVVPDMYAGRLVGFFNAALGW